MAPWMIRVVIALGSAGAVAALLEKLLVGGLLMALAFDVGVPAGRIVPGPL